MYLPYVLMMLVGYELAGGQGERTAAELGGCLDQRAGEAGQESAPSREGTRRHALGLGIT